MKKPQDILAAALTGKYTIKDQIASGGMGTVYLGEHQVLKKRVAIKIVNQDLIEDPEFRRRFLREAKLAAHLEHPHIIDIYDFGSIEGLDYIIMQYVEGRNLKQIINQEGCLALATCIKYMYAMAEAIAFAHKQGVIHRDIKPSNLLVDQNDRIYLTDFGISKDLRDIDLTTIDSVMGSPRYMSPEQKNGMPADHRSDLFSLAIVFYEMLTGAYPFVTGHDDYFDTAFDSGAFAHCDRHDPEISASLGRIILRMLAKDPENRYPQTDQMLREFERDVVQPFFHPGSVRKPSSGRMAGHDPDFFRVMRLGLLSFVLMAVAVGAFFLYDRLSERSADAFHPDRQKMLPLGGENGRKQDALSYGNIVKKIKSLGKDRPAVGIRFWTDQAVYANGEKIIYHFESLEDCFVNIFLITTEEDLLLLFPNKFNPHAQIEAGRSYTIPADAKGICLEIAGPPGEEEVIVMMSDRPFEIMPCVFDTEVFASLGRKNIGPLAQVQKNLSNCSRLHTKHKAYRYRIVPAKEKDIALLDKDK